ncbi:MAG: type I-C CRISPR-associated protein Cas8c/Csd1 [Bdellovibrionota bacterium]
MLISALCDYYDELKEQGKLISKGYKKINVAYLVCLNNDGSIKEIIPLDKGREEIIPEVYKQSPKIMSYIIETRGVYLFGIEGKGQKRKLNKQKFDKFKEAHNGLLEGVDSLIVNAFRNFINTWKPEDVIDNKNEILDGIDLTKHFVFCFEGKVNELLHNDKFVKQKCEELLSINEDEKSDQDKNKAICAITGEKKEISRIHDKINIGKGAALVSFRESAYQSYEKTEAFNSNISEDVMIKYTTSLNHLLKNNDKFKHDIHNIYFATDCNKKSEDLYAMLMYGEDDSQTQEKIEDGLGAIVEKVRRGDFSSEMLKNIDIDPNVNFYIFGLVGTARLSLKYLYKNKFGDIFDNLMVFQKDLAFINSKKEYSKPLTFAKIVYQLKSPKIKNDQVQQDLIVDLISSVLNNGRFPQGLLQCIVMRIKKDSKISKDESAWRFISDDTRLSILKAYINRDCRFNNKKEEIDMSLNKENNNPAYVCGRLFAVCEKIDNTDSLRRGYFATASTQPALVFPKILNLNVHRIEKLADSSKVYCEKLIQEIIDKLNNEFPLRLGLIEQGKFVVGYYQQKQDLYSSKKVSPPEDEDTNAIEE